MNEPNETQAVASGEESTDPWETWSKVALALAALVAGMWAVVLARLGIGSVQVHALIPYVGALSLVVLAWGLVRTLLRPPVLRKSRTIAFFTLLAVGFVSTEPLIPAPLSTEDYQSQLTYELPVRGEWVTLAGGREKARNYHATFPPVRWGFDFTRVVDGAKFELDGKKAADWHCFGEPVYAPVDGEIVRLENHHVDNHPGEISPTSMTGNHVVIKAAPAEFVYLSHLQKGSIVVTLDQQVKRGDLLGRCGNSGQSPEPHLHMHVQDRVEFPIAQGVPIEFSNYVANGEAVVRGMPAGGTDWDAVDGDAISPGK
jgi:hypothetical protein